MSSTCRHARHLPLAGSAGGTGWCLHVLVPPPFPLAEGPLPGSIPAGCDRIAVAEAVAAPPAEAPAGAERAAVDDDGVRLLSSSYSRQLDDYTAAAEALLRRLAVPYVVLWAGRGVEGGVEGGVEDGMEGGVEARVQARVEARVQARVAELLALLE
ncbi:hypothetical protein HXX76_014551 [Chlamydomonas incerta]|uniref:Uncharacterized protein n=1 Tax=Chlamydomonas incerta TaxID=51695 RepID=A0A835SBP4_CHLIN|nr:hypothetical protein HXX76_014551 [Chlamydomonas incerta]|eukprot:KAG2424342.1 hypothetical protein HXX76_014551 [Chlamydomonas incerta]